MVSHYGDPWSNSLRVLGLLRTGIPGDGNTDGSLAAAMCGVTTLLVIAGVRRPSVD